MQHPSRDGTLPLIKGAFRVDFYTILTHFKLIIFSVLLLCIIITISFQKILILVFWIVTKITWQWNFPELRYVIIMHSCNFYRGKLLPCIPSEAWNPWTKLIPAWTHPQNRSNPWTIDIPGRLATMGVPLFMGFWSNLIDSPETCIHLVDHHCLPLAN